jgi:hypothetical protein
VRVIVVLVLVAALPGCRRLLGFEEATPAADSELPIDAGPCEVVGKSCAGDLLRTCTEVGVVPTEIACGWGCIADPPHCGVVTPSGGVVTSADLEATGSAVAIGGTASIDTSTGEITGVRAAGPGLVDGIDFSIRDGVGVFRMKSLTITANLTVTGTGALALVSDGEIVIDGVIDVRGPCTGNLAGPGGHPGGAGNDGAGAGAGGQGNLSGSGCGGGGGAGFGAPGSRGGGALASLRGLGGIVFGTAEILSLSSSGGSGGGSGAASEGGAGGGGGGALQLISNARVRILSGGINAGGCGGSRAQSSSGCGGGGGSGGAILIEAPIVELDGGLAVNGGGGGAAAITNNGQSAQLSSVPATGGNGTAGSGDGGDGGAGISTSGSFGESDVRSGGGGGAVGRIRVNTRLGTVQIGSAGFSSPSVVGSPSAATTGIAPVN